MAFGLVPRRLRSAVAESWARSGHWSPLSLAQTLNGVKLAVKRAERDNHFMYTAAVDRGDGLLLPDSEERPAEIEVLAEDFFAGLATVKGDSSYSYFTAPVQWQELLVKAPGWESLACSDVGDDPRAMRPWLQLWAADGGACTQAHYDVADNVFVQLSGSKEFLLWPPQHSAALHLFPDAHPRARKSQLCIGDPDLCRHPLAAALPPPIRILLQPGDALAVPAFWFHHVTSITPCVSLNVFSESPCKLAAAELLGLPLALHESWPIELKRQGLEVVVRALHEAISTPPVPLIDQILGSRLAPLALPTIDTAARGPDSAESGMPSASGRRRRRKRAPAAPDHVTGLLPVLQEHAAECALAIQRLEAAVGEAALAYDARWLQATQPGGCQVILEGAESLGARQSDDVAHAAMGSAEAHFGALRDLTLMHAIELWVVRLFGPARLEGELAELRRALCSG